MLQSIQTRSTGKAASAVEMLTACHDRIRNFTSVLKKLAHAAGSSPLEISAAAEAAYRYFTVALPLHEADEEQSLRPRLAEAGGPQVNAALEAMGHQHEAIDDLLERILPLLVLISKNPENLAAAQSELCGLSSSLADIFGAHLALEDEVIFPAIATALLPDAQAELLAEMKRRRQQG